MRARKVGDGRTNVRQALERRLAREGLGPDGATRAWAAGEAVKIIRRRRRGCDLLIKADGSIVDVNRGRIIRSPAEREQRCS